LASLRTLTDWAIHLKVTRSYVPNYEVFTFSATVSSSNVKLISTIARELGKLPFFPSEIQCPTVVGFNYVLNFVLGGGAKKVGVVPAIINSWVVRRSMDAVQRVGWPELLNCGGCSVRIRCGRSRREKPSQAR
jgi:hypothetical protein